MNINNVLFISNSLIYRKMVQLSFDELAPKAFVRCESNYVALMSLLKKICFDIIIIDTTLEAISVKDLICQLDSFCPNADKIILCEQKWVDRCDYPSSLMRKLSFIIKPVDDSYDGNLRSIKRSIRVAILKFERSQAGSDVLDATDLPDLPDLIRDAKQLENYDLLLIASSTGGPSALERVLSGLSGSIGVPVLIVQHMPEGFTQNLAKNLDRLSNLDIFEASEGERIRKNTVLIAPGGFHMIIDRENRVRLNKDEYVNGVRPSADVLFKSIAERFRGKSILAVVLTGMGNDGREGVRLLKQDCKCTCLTQSEESCTVYGMPRAVFEAGLSDKSLHLDLMSKYICKLLSANCDGEAN